MSTPNLEERGEIKHMEESEITKYREIVALVSKKRLEPQVMRELADFLIAREIELFFFNLDWHCTQECQKLIRQHGPTYVLSLERLQEAVLEKVDISNKKKFSLLIETLRSKLIALAPSQRLILIDSYMFTQNIPNKGGYLQIFGDVFGPVIGGISELRFITTPGYDKKLYQDVLKLLKNLNPKLLVKLGESNDFHDRFWIVDDKSGLFVGTSLNGIGKRYAVVDNMRSEDTKEIIDTLRSLGLL